MTLRNDPQGPMGTDDSKDTRPLPRKSQPRQLHQIGREIARTWKNPYFGAVPYIEALLYLTDMDSRYGDQPAEDIVMYFLSNSATWRGDDARRIRAELNAMLPERYQRKPRTRRVENTRPL